MPSKEIQELLKIVERNKAKAVKEENFNQAKKAYLAQSQLKMALNDIEGLEVSKKEAIQNNDFDHAQELTEEMKALKNHYLLQIDQKLLEDIPNDPRPTTSKSLLSTISAKSNKSRVSSLSSSTIDTSSITSYSSDDDTEMPRQLFDRIPISPPTTSSRRKTFVYENETLNHGRNMEKLDDSFRIPIPRSSSTPTYMPLSELDYRSPDIKKQKANKFYEKENQIVPAVARKFKKKAIENDTFSNNGDELLTREKLLAAIHPDDRAYATQAVAHFGLDTTAGIYSKNWQNRKNALQEIKQALETNSNFDSQSLLNTALPALVKGLSDKLFNVYAEALELIKYLLLEYLGKHGLTKSDGPKIVNRTYQILISRTGDTVTDRRFAPATHQAINETLQKNSEIATLYMQKFMQPFSISGGSVRSDQGKAKIVWNAANILHAPNNVVNEKQMCSFGVNCINHTDAEIRNIGRNIILYAYTNGNHDIVRKMLPKNSSSKNQLIRSLYAELDHIDGGKEIKTQNQNANNIQSRPLSRPRSVPSTRRKSFSRRSSLVKYVEPQRPRTVQFSNTIVNAGKDKSDPIDYKKICMYCGKLSPSFNNEGLKKHYSKDCPMLTKCAACKEAIETRYLKQHILLDCAHRANYRLHDRCQQPIEKNLFNLHVNSKNCLTAQPESIAGRCLLCNMDVKPNNDIGWRKHLMEKCPANDNRKR